MEWYPLRDTVQPFLGERLTHLFAHAVSTETDCLICSTFFRRLLIESGEDPDALRPERPGPRGRGVSAASSAATRTACPTSMYAELARLFTPEQIVALTAFGAIMFATNVFNNALRVDLDGYLEPLPRPGADRAQRPGSA